MKRKLMLLAFMSAAVLAFSACAGKGGHYPKAKGTVRLVSYNVGGFGKYSDDSAPMIAGMMNEIGADAMAVNELDSCNTRHSVYQLERFAGLMNGWDFEFGKAIDYAGGSYGEGAALKKEFGIVDRYSVPLPQGEGAEARVLVVIETERFVFASTHLDHVSDVARREQARLISAVMKEKYGMSGKPVFLCGDMNALPDSRTMQIFAEDWAVLSEPGFTFPSDTPDCCLDYILALKDTGLYDVTATGICTEFMQGDVTKASDHLPVFVDVRIL